MGKRRRRRADPTEDWEQLQLLCVWEEQREYERIRPLAVRSSISPADGGLRPWRSAIGRRPSARTYRTDRSGARHPLQQRLQAEIDPTSSRLPLAEQPRLIQPGGAVEQAPDGDGGLGGGPLARHVPD
jgi:hypothetical protein